MRRFRSTGSPLLHGPTVGQRCVFGYDRDRVANETWIVLIGFVDLQSIDDLHMSSDSYILIEDCAIDQTAGADTDRDGSRCRVGCDVRVGLGVVGPHDNAIANGYPFANHTSETDHAVFNPRSFANSATISDERTRNRGAIHDSRWQESSAAVDGMGSVEKIELGIRIAECQVRIIERANGTDILPVIIEQVNLYFAGTDCGREDFFAEVAVVGFVQNVEEQFFVEDVEAHAGQAIAAL